MKSTRSKFSTLKQICELIPGHLVAKLARKHGVDEQARTFSPWSPVAARFRRTSAVFLARRLIGA